MAKFIPYTGGAGPSEEQSKENDMALMEALRKKGFKPKYVPHPYNEAIFGSHKDEYITVVRVGKRYGSYDRWGFVCGTAYRDKLDQCSFEQAVAYLAREYTPQN